MRINDPAVIAELTKCHEVYEKALIENDAETLDALFWDSPHATRFGVMENLHGSEEIRAFRRGRPKINLDREIRRLDITAFGDQTAIINLEFLRLMDGVERHGRQTQFWFLFEEGWRIASAHVSLLPVATNGSAGRYLKATSSEIGIRIEEAYQPAVEEELRRLAGVAGFLMQFPLSQDVEAAAVFQA